MSPFHALFPNHSTSLSHVSSQQTLFIALYLALANDRDTVCYFLDFQEIKEYLSITHYPAMDLLVSRQPTQSL